MNTVFQSLALKMMPTPLIISPSCSQSADCIQTGRRSHCCTRQPEVLEFQGCWAPSSLASQAPQYNKYTRGRERNRWNMVNLKKNRSIICCIFLCFNHYIFSYMLNQTNQQKNSTEHNYHQLYEQLDCNRNPDMICCIFFMF